ncbi:MAG: prepilin peptidase [Eubacteriales bacterium]|nr:prepilin peptidase [Eubacteriales bacterium]
MLKEICILGFLGLNTWTDIRRKEISLVAAAVFAAGSLIWTACTGRISTSFFIPVGISAFFLVVSIVTKGALGMGDGWLMMALGIAMETEEFLVMLLIGLGGSAIWAGILLVILHKERKAEIPFVPFLFLGYIGGVLLWK